jgi:hypothetical protein
MPSTIKLSDACSVGEDLNINQFFVGRDMELKRALEAIRQKRMVVVDGYTMAGKSYFALQCLKNLGIEVQSPSRPTFQTGIDAAPLGIFTNLNANYRENNLFESVILQVLLGTGDFKGLISILPMASSRREFTQRAVALNVFGDRIPASPKIRFERVIELFEDAVNHLKSANGRAFSLVICLDNLNGRSLDSFFLQFINRAIKLGVQFIITRSTPRDSSDWIEFDDQFPHSEVIHIRRMPLHEVNAIVDRIEFNLFSHFHFTVGARQLIFELSGGLAYFVHYICGGALEVADYIKETTIDENLISEMTQMIRDGLYLSQFEGVFSSANRSPKQNRQLESYASQPLSDLDFSIPFSQEGDVVPIGFLLNNGDNFLLIGSPPVQVYAKLRLGYR